MQLKTLSIATLIVFASIFSLPAYSAYPDNTNTHWQSNKDLNFENPEAQQFSMVSTLERLLKDQETMQEDLIHLNEETKELIQVLADRDQVAHASRKICLDSRCS